jgi:hypothetical protein
LVLKPDALIGQALGRLTAETDGALRRKRDRNTVVQDRLSASHFGRRPERIGTGRALFRTLFRTLPLFSSFLFPTD